jgi:hypothetical protein
VFVPGGKGVSLSYAPWLRQAAANMWISQLSGFFMPGRNQAVGASLVYFNQGAVSLRDMNRQRTGDFNPREFALTGTYALKLSEYASLAAGLKYVYSNLVGSSATGLDGRPAHALAGDVGAYFQTDPGELHRLNVAFGTTLSNLGTRVNYGTSERYFLPTNLRVGTGVTYRFGEEGRLTFALDANKLMLPSRPVYDFPDLGPPTIVRGRNPDRDYFSSIFGSFGDSPDRLAGELKEVGVGRRRGTVAQPILRPAERLLPRIGAGRRPAVLHGGNRHPLQRPGPGRLLPGAAVAQPPAGRDGTPHPHADLAAPGVAQRPGVFGQPVRGTVVRRLRERHPAV